MIFYFVDCQDEPSYLLVKIHIQVMCETVVISKLHDIIVKKLPDSTLSHHIHVLLSLFPIMSSGWLFFKVNQLNTFSALSLICVLY